MAKGNKKKKTMPVTAREVGPQNRPAPEGQPKAKTKKPGEPKAGTREVVMTKQQSKDPDAEPEPSNSEESLDNDDDDDDVEHQNQNQNQHQFQSEQRILDRSGTLRQSRGRWGVERRLSRALREERIRGGICCCRKIYQDCGKDWFFWLVYQKTFVLFLLLFFSYSLIVCFFGFVYLVRILDIRQIHDTCSISGCMTCNSD